MTPLERAAQAPINVLVPLLGYREKQSNAQLTELTANAGSSNYTMFADYFDQLWEQGYKFYNTRKNGPSGEWCDMTVDYSVVKGTAKGDPELGRKILHQPLESCGAGCAFSAGYYRANNAWLSAGQRPKTGDQIFFGKYKSETHTGIVEWADDNYVHTIEGNTNNMLARRTYSLDDARISGYGRPNYALAAHLWADEVDEETPIQDDVETLSACTVTLPVLKYGSRNGHVKTCQALLNHYFGAGLTVDGYFGRVTEKAVKDYQTSRKLGADGIVGAYTWAKLLR